ncbi:MAG: hypothetical protein GJ680_07380 [Alteromonadaceae bacterium]|nr:hypothetical protein [Alteromonadaceae bacterium]
MAQQDTKQKSQLSTLTMTLEVAVSSAMLQNYFEKAQGLTVSMFERIGALQAMLAKDKPLIEMVKLWQQTNMQIAKEQIVEIAIRREAIEIAHPDVTFPKFTTPKEWGISFEATHPALHDLREVLETLNAELSAMERLFMMRVIDETEVERCKTATITILSGLTDRIAKATYPGKRQQASGSFYSPAKLTGHIRNGFRLEFEDAPNAFIDLIKEYEEKTSAFKTAQGDAAKAQSVKAAKKPKQAQKRVA